MCAHISASSASAANFCCTQHHAASTKRPAASRNRENSGRPVFTSVHSSILPAASSLLFGKCQTADCPDPSSCLGIGIHSVSLVLRVSPAAPVLTLLQVLAQLRYLSSKLSVSACTADLAGQVLNLCHKLPVSMGVTHTAGFVMVRSALAACLMQCRSIQSICLHSWLHITIAQQVGLYRTFWGCSAMPSPAYPRGIRRAASA